MLDFSHLYDWDKGSAGSHHAVLLSKGMCCVLSFLLGSLCVEAREGKVITPTDWGKTLTVNTNLRQNRGIIRRIYVEIKCYCV